eukprot:TRINITY_DN6833_c0_g1_i10.p2 TRINITY_DN6833_c0_g1~~TRINITY_DN6833_c0_g1_i10.p2  ORF type:complete len:149 (+),score=25.84 TRINITY_DN6833_c0_g1_i10:1013-1459(+)
MRFEHNPNNHRGILYWLGTQFQTCEWVNPANTGIVGVEVSSIENGNPFSVLELQNPIVEFWTMDIPSSWFAVDLRKWSVLPCAYTIRHGGNYIAESLRNWDFQASVNGNDWDTLRRHKFDESLNGPFAHATWTLKKQPGYFSLSTPTS